MYDTVVKAQLGHPAYCSATVSDAELLLVPTYIEKLAGAYPVALTARRVREGAKLVR